MRRCRSCDVQFEPRAVGQIACTFACARLMVAREASRTPATKLEARISEALAETRANVAALKGEPS